jgi:hypothetical protein
MFFAKDNAGEELVPSTDSVYMVHRETVIFNRKSSALRICLDAFRTSPIPSLHVEASEMPLRQQKLTLQGYTIKLKSSPSNRACARLQSSLLMPDQRLSQPLA